MRDVGSSPSVLKRANIRSSSQTQANVTGIATIEIVTAKAFGGIAASVPNTPGSKHFVRTIRFTVQRASSSIAKTLY